MPYVLSVYKLFSNNELKFYRHKLVSDEDFDFLVNNMRGVMEETKETAKVLASTNNAIVYKINNEIYFIPAKIRAVINNGDNKLLTYYDYPCEMKREDLTEI